jgi:hypothetical protein
VFEVPLAPAWHQPKPVMGLELQKGNTETPVHGAEVLFTCYVELNNCVKLKLERPAHKARRISKPQLH